MPKKSFICICSLITSLANICDEGGERVINNNVNLGPINKNALNWQRSAMKNPKNPETSNHIQVVESASKGKGMPRTIWPYIDKQTHAIKSLMKLIANAPTCFPAEFQHKAEMVHKIAVAIAAISPILFVNMLFPMWGIVDGTL